MKSNLFKKTDYLRTKDFVKDLRELLSLDDEVIEKIPEYAIKDYLTPTPKESGEVRDKVAKELKIPRAKLNHIIDLSNHFIKRFLPTGDAENDEPLVLASDSIEITDGSSEKEEVITSYFSKLKEGTKAEVEFHARKRSHVMSCISHIDTIESVLDYRIILDKKLELNQSVQDYNPTCLGVVPIGILKFGLSSEETKEVVFQIDKRTIQILKNELEALEKQMEISQSFLRLS